MSKKFVLVLVGVMVCAAAFANGNLTGTVHLGPPPAGPAAGATVVLHRNMHPGDSLSTTADTAGHFEFTDIASGGWIAVAIMEGYLPSMPHMVWVPENGGTEHVDLMLGPPIGEAGSVAGNVLLSAGGPAVDAAVHLAQLGDPFHPHGFMAETHTDAQGAFAFATVPAGLYNINAMLMGEGFAATTIEVVSSQTTNVTLTLDDNHMPCDTCHHWHPGPCDSLQLVDLTGVVSVNVDTNGMHPMPHYFLDVNGDGQADYRLSFGPPWYDPNGPDNPPNRPADGDSVSIHGGLMTYGDPPMVIVYQINGLQWREPCHHGGFGGGHHGFGCDPDSISAIEVEGTALVHGMGPHGMFDMYAIDTNNDTLPDYALMFGPDPNGPDSLPNYPANGDQISIVGGLMECANLPLGVIIVYEINGMIWREPGDTSGFSQYDILSTGDPVAVPSKFLTASNYPNPFNPTTEINYTVPSSSRVTLKVYDIVGREVATLVNASQAAGTYSVNWNAANMPSGIYVYRLSAGNQSFTNKMVLMK